MRKRLLAKRLQLCCAHRSIRLVLHQVLALWTGHRRRLAFEPSLEMIVSFANIPLPSRWVVCAVLYISFSLQIYLFIYVFIYLYCKP